MRKSATLKGLATFGPGGYVMKKISYVFFLLFAGVAALSAFDTAQLKKNLDDPSASVRMQAVSQISDSRIAELGEAVIPRLNDLDLGVRKAAIDCLGKLRVAQALPKIVVYFNDPKAEVRLSALLAVGTMSDPAYSKEVAALLADQDDGVRNAAVRISGRLKAPEAKEPLLALLTEKNEIIVKDAVWSLGEIGDPTVRFRFYEILRSSLASPAPIVKQEIAKALGNFRESDSVEYLEKLFNEEDATLKINSAKALALLKNSAGQKFAIELLSNPDKNIRYQAVQILGEIGSLRAKEALKKVSELDADDEIKNIAKEYLTK